MTSHAGFSGRDAGKRRFLHRGVAVTAIDPVVSDMMFVAKRDRLLQRNIDLRGVGRPVNSRSRPTGSTDQNNQAQNSDARMHIRAFREKLSHDELRFVFVFAERNRECKQTRTPAIRYAIILSARLRSRANSNTWLAVWSSREVA